MSQPAMLLTVMTLLLVALLLLAPGVQAQSGSDDLSSPSAGYELSWWTVDGGGRTSYAGTSYGMAGSIGQPDAQVWQGGGYTLIGGFWHGRLTLGQHTYLPLVLRSF